MGAGTSWQLVLSITACSCEVDFLRSILHDLSGQADQERATTVRRGIARSRLTCCELVTIFEHRLAAKGRKFVETAISAGFLEALRTTGIRGGQGGRGYCTTTRCTPVRLTQGGAYFGRLKADGCCLDSVVSGSADNLSCESIDSSCLPPAL